MLAALFKKNTEHLYSFDSYGILNVPFFNSGARYLLVLGASYILVGASYIYEFQGGLIVMIFLYIPYANFKLFLKHINSLRLPKEYLNSHNCLFDINIVKIPTI